jgi:hypothetical protein
MGYENIGWVDKSINIRVHYFKTGQFGISRKTYYVLLSFTEIRTNYMTVVININLSCLNNP